MLTIINLARLSIIAGLVILSEMRVSDRACYLLSSVTYTGPLVGLAHTVCTARSQRNSSP